MLRGAMIAGLALLSAGCGTVSQPRAAPIPTASCAQDQPIAAPYPGEPGVYRAGPLRLVVGDDLARVRGTRPTGREAIVVVLGNRLVSMSVDRASRPGFSLQFTPVYPGSRVARIGDGRPEVAFPACGTAVHRFRGGILFAGPGCARLHVGEAGARPVALAIPIGQPAC